MKKILISLVAVCFATMFCACSVNIEGLYEDGSGVLETYEKELSDGVYELNISGFGVTNPVKMQLTIDPSLDDKIMITGDDNIMKHLDIDVSDLTKRIDIEFDGVSSYNNSTMIVYVGVSIDELNASSAYDISYITDCDTLTCELSGACDANITALKPLKSATFHLSGASDAYVEGICKKASIKLSGASDFSAFDFLCERGSVSGSGASTCYVCFSEEADFYASGATEIFYKGEAEVSTSASGASTIEKR